MKVSHEVPLELLEKSREFNDYDYALVHLFETHPQYLEFYKESVRRGRDVLLDNSIFELKEAFSMERFAYWINELRPTRYIIPDVMYNLSRTAENIHVWNQQYKQSLRGRTIGVVQGSTYDEVTACYKYIILTCDEVAINISKPLMLNFSEAKGDDYNIMRTRQSLISTWLKEGVIDKEKNHHLLGCTLPQEFSYYKEMPFITSLDTSNPIVHGMLGIRYDNFGLLKKEKVLLADLIDTKLTRTQIIDIESNIIKFKNLMNKSL